MITNSLTPRQTLLRLAMVLVFSATMLPITFIERVDAAVDALATRIRLLSQSPFVAPTDDFTMELDIDSTGMPDDATVTFNLYGSVTVRGSDPRRTFEETVQGAGLSSDLRLGTRNRLLAELERTSSTTVRVTLPIIPEHPEPENGFGIVGAGVYPLTVTLWSPSDQQPPPPPDLTTFLVRLPAVGDADRADRTRPLEPLRVASIVPIHAPPALRPDGTQGLKPESISTIDQTIATLADHPTRLPLTIDPTPETIDALAARDQTENRDEVGRLAGSLKGRQVLASTYVSVHTNSWLSAAMDSELARQISKGTDALGATLNPTPLPDRRTWIADVDTTADTYAALQDRDLVDQVVVADDSLLPPDLKLVDPKQLVQRLSAQTLAKPFDIQNSQGGRLRAAASDDRLRSRLTATDNPVLNAQILIADLAVIWAEHPAEERGVVLTIAPSNHTELKAFDAFLAALAKPRDPSSSQHIIEPTTLNGIFEIEPSRAAAARGTSPGALIRPLKPRLATELAASVGSYPRDLAAAEVSLAGFRSMIAGDAEDRTAPLQRLLDVSGADEFDSDTRQSYLDATTAHVNRQAAGIKAPPESEGVTLAASDAPIPLVLENSLDYAVRVRIAFSSDKLEFPDGNEITETLEPGTTKLSIRVHARASGAFPLDIRLSSPDQNITLATNRFTVRSTAISGIGLALSVGAGFFLLIWWARNFRSTRRAARLVNEDDPKETTDP